MNRILTEKQIKVLAKLADSIEEIENVDDNIMIKFKGNVVLKNKNFVNLSDGFNINYATQIHLNPDYPRELVEDGINRLFDVKIGIVKNMLMKMGYKLPESEIIEIVRGNKQIEGKIDVDKAIEIMNKHLNVDIENKKCDEG